jgi:mannose-6-phosphate isomerase-like protein (cupin superfamily)
MQGFFTSIERTTKENADFRRVLYTGKNSQLVLMSVPAHGEIGEEVHDVDQFIRVEDGSGKAVLDGVEHVVEADTAMVIPAGTKHNVVNTGNADMKLYTVYSPPHHKDGTVHKTKADAEASDEHFDGTTTE